MVAAVSVVLSTQAHFEVLPFRFVFLLQCMQVWSGILQRSSGEEIASAIAPLFQSMAWLWLLVVPSHAPIETNLLVPPSPEATVK